MGAVGWLKGFAGLVGGLAVVANLPTSLWLTSEMATEEYLGDADLNVIGGDRKQFKVSTSVQWLK